MKYKSQVVSTRESRDCDDSRADGKPSVLAPRQFVFYRHMRGREYTSRRERGYAGLYPVFVLMCVKLTPIMRKSLGQNYSLCFPSCYCLLRSLSSRVVERTLPRQVAVLATLSDMEEHGRHCESSEVGRRQRIVYHHAYRTEFSHNARRQLTDQEPPGRGLST